MQTPGMDLSLPGQGCFNSPRHGTAAGIMNYCAIRRTQHYTDEMPRRLSQRIAHSGPCCLTSPLLRCIVVTTIVYLIDRTLN